MQPKVSVIVAVYNAEKYITRCIESLLSQTLKDFEVIIIDDGSPDRCGKICDEYALKDSRFNVIHQKNAGVANARKRGIATACGEYSIHVDPDDWVAPNYLLFLYEAAVNNKADVVICDFISINNASEQTYRKQNIDCISSSSVFLDLLLDKGNVGLCNKLIRHSLYFEYNIKHNTNLTTGEDFYILSQLFLQCLKVAYVPKALYYYDYSNVNSLTKKVSEQQLKSQIFIIDYIDNHYKDKYFQEGILFRKMKLKRWMWNSCYFSKVETIEAYKDINPFFLNDRLRFGLRSDISYGLNNHYYLGRFLQKLNILKLKVQVLISSNFKYCIHELQILSHNTAL